MSMSVCEYALTLIGLVQLGHGSAAGLGRLGRCGCVAALVFVGAGQLGHHSALRSPFPADGVQWIVLG